MSEYGETDQTIAEVESVLLKRFGQKMDKKYRNALYDIVASVSEKPCEIAAVLITQILMTDLTLSRTSRQIQPFKKRVRVTMQGIDNMYIQKEISKNMYSLCKQGLCNLLRS